LNTAWGSNYTQFSSTGVQVTNEVIGTCDGTAGPYAFTLAHAHASPYAVAILQGATLKASDVAADGIASTGAFWEHLQTTADTGSLNYTSGAGSITFKSVCTAGTTIYATYIYNGWNWGSGVADE